MRWFDLARCLFVIGLVVADPDGELLVVLSSWSMDLVLEGKLFERMHVRYNMVVLGCIGSMPRGMVPTNPTTIPTFSTDHRTTSRRGAPPQAWMRQHHARNVEDTVQWRLIPLKKIEERNEDVRVTGEDGTNETKAKQTERRRTNDRDVPRADPMR